ncbi:hypothetical protein SK128_020643, partial [Halocaridina rubra]
MLLLAFIVASCIYFIVHKNQTQGTANSDNAPPNISTNVPECAQKTRDECEGLAEQDRALKELGCSPKPIKMNTEDVLDKGDSLKEEKIVTKFVMVNKCQENSSYCPGN